MRLRRRERKREEKNLKRQVRLQSARNKAQPKTPAFPQSQSGEKRRGRKPKAAVIIAAQDSLVAKVRVEPDLKCPEEPL